MVYNIGLFRKQAHVRSAEVEELLGMLREPFNSTRNTTNLGGGQNDATFINDPGYGLDFYASGGGNPFVLGRRAVLSNANVFNNFGDFSTIAGSGAKEVHVEMVTTPPWTPALMSDDAKKALGFF